LPAFIGALAPTRTACRPGDDLVLAQLISLTISARVTCAKHIVI